MRSSLTATFALLMVLVAAPASAVLPDDSTNVVVSIAVSAGILEPGEFPVAGRSCDAVLSQLQEKENFAGRIRDSYEPPADAGRCFNLEGKSAQMAVVCCAPPRQN